MGIWEKNGFTLLEVIIAVTLIALIAASALGLTSYHQSVAARVAKRFLLYNQAAALLTEIPDIIKQEDEKFPFLEKDEEMREFEGVSGVYRWKLQLTRVVGTGLPVFYQIKLDVKDDKYQAGFVKYLPART